MIANEIEEVQNKVDIPIPLMLENEEESDKIYMPGITYVRILEYFQEEKERFKDKFKFEDIEKFIQKFFDPKVNMKICFLHEQDDNLLLGKYS